MSPFIVRWLKFSLVALVGCGFLAMAIYAFVKRDEIRNAQVEPPLVSPPMEAVKRRPEQPGGMDIPNRDKMVFDLLEDASQTASVNASADMSSSDMVQPSAGSAPTVNEVIATAKALPDASTTAVVEPLPQAKPVEAVVNAPVVEKKVVHVEPVKTPEPVMVKKEEKKVEEKVASSWGVQLGAVGSRTDAEKAAANLAKNAALKGLKSRIVVTPDGKHFRIQFVGAKDRAAATAICSKLGTKQPCFPVAP